MLSLIQHFYFTIIDSEIYPLSWYMIANYNETLEQTT